MIPSDDLLHLADLVVASGRHRRDRGLDDFDGTSMLLAAVVAGATVRAAVVFGQRLGRDVGGGAVVVALLVASIIDGRWMPAVLLLAIAVAGVVARAERPELASAPPGRGPAAIAPVLVALAAAGGAWACLPDTEQALLVLGVALGAVVATAVGGTHGIGAASTVVAAVLGLALGDVARSSAVVGTVGCAAAAAAALVVLERGAGRTLGRAALVVAGTAGVALWESRVAGLADGAAPAVALAAVALVPWAAVLAWLGRPGAAA